MNQKCIELDDTDDPDCSDDLKNHDDAELKLEADEYINRTIIVHPKQSGSFSKLIRKLQVFQAHMFNKGIEYGLHEKYEHIKAGYLITKLYNEEPWMKNFSRCVAETAFLEGYRAVDAWLKVNNKNRSRRKWGKETAEKNHGWAEQLLVKPNRWSEYKKLFRHSDSFKFPALVVSGPDISVRVKTWGKLELNLPGIGKIIIKGDLEELKETRYVKLDKSTGGAKSRKGFYHNNIVSYQIVETTKKFTKRTNDENRTFELHLNLRVYKPVKERPDAGEYAAEEPETIIGIDMGVKNNLVIFDGKDSQSFTPPSDCKREPNDPISIQQSIRDQYDYHSNNWWKSDRKLWNMRDDLANRRINYDRHLAKLLANETGAIVIEKLNIKGMIKYVKWLKAFNRNLHYARMGKMAQYIINAAENVGTKMIQIMPHYTSITCCRCNYMDRRSRVTRDWFKCTNCKFECDADINAAINIYFYGMPCIRKHPVFDYDGNYKSDPDNIKAFNEYLMNLSNLRLAGGRDDRPGLSSSGDYSKTAISSWGLHPGVPSNNDDNQIGEDSRDVRKKTIVT